MTPISESRQPADLVVKPIKDWPSANQRFYAEFRKWLQDGGYGGSSLKLYTIAARLSLGLLDKPYMMIDLQADPSTGSGRDLEQVWEHVVAHVPSPATRANYRKGLTKLAQYLRLRCHRRPPPKQVNWEYYVGPLPDWLATDVRAFLAHRRRAWIPERRYRATLELLSNLTRSLRWMTAQAPVGAIADLTPALWHDYVDARLAKGLQPATVNLELGCLHEFLQFLADEGRPICHKMLRVKPLPVAPRLPRDVPVDQLRRLMQEIEVEAASTRTGCRRRGIMDRAWFLLMLHCGLRVGEVCRLRLSDLDLEGRRVRIERSKHLKDRVVYLSDAAAAALEAYLAVRGPVASDHVFAYRHRPLSPGHCNRRLCTYAKRCGVRVTTHQLRHSAATLLLNAGAPILTVQALLGHRHIDTTLGYARLYDGTVAADYYQAMAGIEARLEMGSETQESWLNAGQLLALVDSLRDGTLNQAQKETVQVLRAGILALAEVSEASL